MPEAESLRRLGTGRWQSRDGRFTIEPQSGTWVVLDAEQTDELGLPLVRGPFRSLGAARDALDAARHQEPSSSPLASRIESAKARPKAARAKPAGKKDADPAWLAALDPGRRRRARDLIGRLSKEGVTQAEEVARAEIVDDEPALARLAIERRVRAALTSSRDPETLARALGEVIVGGADEALGAIWRVVDGAGRPIARLDLTPEEPR